jgi:lipopolysaccharide export system protein LptC
MLARPTETIDELPPPAPAAAEAAIARDNLFRTAERHSRRVRMLKIVLPSLAVLMAAGFLFQTYRSTPSSVDVSADNSAVTEGKLVMANPRLEGFTNESLPYSVSAMRAVQDVADEAIIELQGIAASLPIDPERSATVETARGIFDQTKNLLTIDKEIDIKTTDGAVAKLASAEIDMSSGRMTSDKPVSIKYKTASIKSGSMSAEKNGKVVIFDNHVQVNIVPPKPAETASQ